jgi:hypothetical protein
MPTERTRTPEEMETIRQNLHEGAAASAKGPEAFSRWYRQKFHREISEGNNLPVTIKDENSPKEG